VEEGAWAAILHGAGEGALPLYPAPSRLVSQLDSTVPKKGELRLYLRGLRLHTCILKSVLCFSETRSTGIYEHLLYTRCVHWGTEMKLGSLPSGARVCVCSRMGSEV
jgi:hypothetical protein